ncbi:hypothetical protein N9L56_00215 [Gammaproteobacteria bacterium]|nr:hypothetical protein [Gammaproteobacteria bacterium]
MNKFEQTIKRSTDFFSTHIFIKSSLNAVVASLVFSLLIIFILSPKFLISSTLLENTGNADTQKIDGVGGLLQSLSSGSANTNFEKFRSRLESASVAKRMWAEGWGRKVFAPGTDYEIDQIPKSQSLRARLSALLLGYKLNDTYTYNDLKQYIKASVALTKVGRSSKIVAEMQSADVEFAKEFLDAIIYIADSEAKKGEIELTRSRIESLKGGLIDSKNAIVTSGLSNLLNSAYFSLVTLESDLPYFVIIVDKAGSSETPITPNIFLIIFANLITFLSLSAAISYFRANKEQIW